jgi:hypothetical protein
LSSVEHWHWVAVPQQGRVTCKIDRFDARTGRLLLPDFRRFAERTKAVDAAWSSCPSSGDRWTRTGVAWGTNNAPVQVANASGLLGVQKPGHDHPDNPYTAATEKIVADLAYNLGLPVPPVTLWDRGTAAGSPRYVAVSAWAYTGALQWGQVEAHFTPNQRNELLPWASAMIPFETWLAAQDRQNAGNMLAALGPGGETLGAWIDYAFSLDYVWKGNHMPDCQVTALYPPVGAPVRDVMIAVADKIAAVDNALIEGIVNRVPSEYLPRNVAENIIRNLISRRATLRAAL